MAILNCIALLFCSLCAYRIGKLNGFNTGLTYLRQKGVHQSKEGEEHYCNVTMCNVVCFEREGELWVKEYGCFNEKEGRTYMVFHCPWCGYQTKKSKMHEMVKIKRGKCEI